MSICLRVSHRLDLFVLSCFFLTVESQRGQVLPPQNVSLCWTSDFEPVLSWEPPSMENCEYIVNFMTTEKQETNRLTSSPWNKTIVTGRGFLRLTVKTCCNDTSFSDEVSSYPGLDGPYPELVRDLNCYVYAANRIKCDWLPASHALHFPIGRNKLRPVSSCFVAELFVGPEPRTTKLNKTPLFSVSISDPPPVPHIQECSSYRYTGSIRTGCDLAGGFHSKLYMSFNGTLNNTFARNTFENNLNTVRPPPLSWNVAKTGQKFFISWTPPDIKLHWMYILNYTECTEPKIKDAKGEKKSIEFELVPHCRYCMAIKAKVEDLEGSETPWSEEQCFDADADPNAMLYVAVIIVLVLGGLAALLFVCCRNNKEKIFPKVPEPVDLISDISENNNKNTLLSLYVLTAEEENCKITLVEDPFINKLDF